MNPPPELIPFLDDLARMVADSVLREYQALEPMFSGEIRAKNQEVAKERWRRTGKRVRGIRRAIFNASDGHCHYCDITLDLRGDWHIEHKLPRSRGGTDSPENLVASCVSCNRKKGTLTPDEFAAVLAMRAGK